MAQVRVGSPEIRTLLLGDLACYFVRLVKGVRTDIGGRDALYNGVFYFSNTFADLAAGVKALSRIVGCKV